MEVLAGIILVAFGLIVGCLWGFEVGLKRGRDAGRTYGYERGQAAANGETGDTFTFRVIGDDDEA